MVRGGTGAEPGVEGMAPGAVEVAPGGLGIAPGELGIAPGVEGVAWWRGTGAVARATWIPELEPEFAAIAAGPPKASSRLDAKEKTSGNRSSRSLAIAFSMTMLKGRGIDGSSEFGDSGCLNKMPPITSRSVFPTKGSIPVSIS